MAEQPITWPRKTRELHNHHMDSTVWNDVVFRAGDIVIATGVGHHDVGSATSDRFLRTPTRSPETGKLDPGLQGCRVQVDGAGSHPDHGGRGSSIERDPVPHRYVHHP